MINQLRQWVLTATVFVVLALSLIPFLSMLMMATHNNNEIFKGQILSLGKHLGDNIEKVFAMNFDMFFFNSIYIAVLSTALAALCSLMTAYSLSKFTYKYRELIFAAVIFIMMIPGQLGLISFIIEMSWLGWVNTHLPFIVPAAANSFGVFWLTMYMRSAIPMGVIESARMDGAHELIILFKIVMPLTSPALVVFCLQSFLGSWNNFTVPSLILSDENLWTIPLAITRLGNMYMADYGARIAGLAVTTFPLIFALMFSSKYFTRGMVTGVIKG